ncbi:hypothetical protein [uncultured Litoreibacter sp.]|uniref:hypothetical protein n=1 Tax=uncultured Litoreibacter sp. TaxID=1392394 RepID=UPI002616F12B|nr:hypothetical protein [uncultured Litoreibacter sp.]
MAHQNTRIGWVAFLCFAILLHFPPSVTPSVANGSLFVAAPAQTKGGLIMQRASAPATMTATLAPTPPPIIGETSRTVASLFRKAPDKGMFRPISQSSLRAARRSKAGAGRASDDIAAHIPARSRGPKLAANSSQIDRLRQLIETAESRHDGYDAVQHRAKVKPARLPTRMTLFEIYTWIDNTPGQPHAIGRYQFIPATLRRLVKRLELPLGTRFSPAIQDQLADILLAEAGLNRLQRGEITRETFMKNLAKIWAGLPTSTGKSYYDGYAGNSASISWAAFDREMGKIFPTKSPS